MKYVRALVPVAPAYILTSLILAKEAFKDLVSVKQLLATVPAILALSHAERDVSQFTTAERIRVCSENIRRS